MTEVLDKLSGNCLLKLLIFGICLQNDVVHFPKLKRFVKILKKQLQMFIVLILLYTIFKVFTVNNTKS